MPSCRSSSNKWIDRAAIEVLGLDAEQAASITRFIVDGRRGEGLRLRVYWNNLGKKEIFDLLPTANGTYELAEVKNA